VLGGEGNVPIREEGATGCGRLGAKVWDKMAEFYTARYAA